MAISWARRSRNEGVGLVPVHMNSPTEDLDERPWEQPGCVRRDCEPHRGHVLALLARTVLLCGVASYCVIVPGVVSLPLGMTVLAMARRDLKKMRAGLMEPSGKRQTEVAAHECIGGIVVTIFGLAFWGLLYACR
jgi:hypothetical protein